MNFHWSISRITCRPLHSRSRSARWHGGLCRTASPEYNRGKSGRNRHDPECPQTRVEIFHPCLCATLCAPGSASAKARITTFDPKDLIGTYPWESNADGSIVGFWYNGNDDITRGFIRAPDGTLTTFDNDGSQVTAAYGINRKNVSTGYWTNLQGDFPGFIRDADGTMTTFHAPGDDNGTYPIGINNKGTVAGAYYDTYDVPHGFLRTRGGNITTFDLPGDTYGTMPMGLNAGNVIAGHYGDSNMVYHGFVRGTDGTVMTFDVPGDTNGTFPESIDAAGTIAGYYGDAKSVFHGFVRTSDGTISPFDPTGSAGTFATSVNSRGEIAG